MRKPQWFFHHTTPSHHPLCNPNTESLKGSPRPRLHGSKGAQSASIYPKLWSNNGEHWGTYGKTMSQATLCSALFAQSEYVFHDKSFANGCFLKLDSSLFGRTCRLGGSPIGRHFVFRKRTSSSTLGGTQLAHLCPASPTDRGWLIISRPPDPKNGDLPSQMGIWFNHQE